GGELDRVRPRFPDPCLRVLGQSTKRHVARGDLVPGAGHADLGLGPVLVAHPDGAQHGASAGLLDALGDVPAADLVGHGPESYTRPGPGRQGMSCPRMAPSGNCELWTLT